jgi:glutathione peroxidase-family protein
MKRSLFPPAFLGLIVVPILATGALNDDAGKTADQLWADVEKARTAEKEGMKGNSPAQVMQSLAAQKAAAQTFLERFPGDPHRWEARMVALRAVMQAQRYNGEKCDVEADRKQLDAILNAPDAPTAVKGEAAFAGAMLAIFETGGTSAFASFYKAAADFYEKYPGHALTEDLKNVELQVLAEDSSPQADELLREMAGGSDRKVASVAKATLKRKAKLAEFREKPIDLKFTALDGKHFDLADLRGKVVLVSFWASWCGPAMTEMPNVVSTYERLHPAGFEIVGITLDASKLDLEGVLERERITWPQYFEAGGTNKFTRMFGVDSIPTAWLIDKKGLLRETGLRGPALGAAVEKLLAE